MISASRMRVFDVLFARWLGNAGIFSLHSIIFWSTQVSGSKKVLYLTGAPTMSASNNILLRQGQSKNNTRN